jgi:hypothetical protein
MKYYDITNPQELALEVIENWAFSIHALNKVFSLQIIQEQRGFFSVQQKNFFGHFSLSENCNF